jgi:hypothetical protein
MPALNLSATTLSAVDLACITFETGPKNKLSTYYLTFGTSMLGSNSSSSEIVPSNNMMNSACTKSSFVGGLRAV